MVPEKAAKMVSQMSPKVAPKMAPKVAPKLALKVAPKLAKMAPKVAPKLAPKLAPKVAPKLAPKVAKMGGKIDQGGAALAIWKPFSSYVGYLRGGFEYFSSKHHNNYIEEWSTWLPNWSKMEPQLAPKSMENGLQEALNKKDEK